MASWAIACRTASRTHTGPGRKNRTCPGFPPVGSNACVMRSRILLAPREARQPRGQLADRVEEGIGRHARELLASARAAGHQSDPAAGGPSELVVDLHVADDDGLVGQG